jgi:hypothetical protein
MILYIVFAGHRQDMIMAALKRAEDAMSEAKRSSRNQVFVA